MLKNRLKERRAALGVNQQELGRLMSLHLAWEMAEG